MRNSRLFILGLWFVIALSTQDGNAQDYTRKGLPEGAKMRIGKGWISGDVTFSADGTVLAVPCRTGVWLYDVETGAEINLLVGHTEPVSSVAFSPDGKILAGGSWDNTIRLWDVQTGKGTHALTGHTENVGTMAFSPDGTTLASASWDSTVRLWDVRTGIGIHAFESNTDGRTAIAFSPDGLTLAGWRGSTIHLWDLETGEPVNALERGQRWLRSIGISLDGTTLVGESANSTIHSPNDSVVEVVPSFKGHLDKIKSVAYSPDGSTLAIAMKDWDSVWGDNVVIRLWDTRTGEMLYALTGHWNADNVLTDIYVAFSPDGDTLASAGSSRSMVRLWDARTGKLLGRPETFADGVSSIAFSPDGSTLFWTEGTVIRLWDVGTGLRRWPYFGGHSKSVNSIAFSPDGATLGSGSWDGSIGLWDVRARENKQLFFAHEGGVTSVAFSPDGFTLASGGRDKTVRLWDARTGEHIRALSGKMDEIVTVAFSHDGEMLASCSSGLEPWSDSSDHTIRIWDARTGVHLHKLEGHSDGVSCMTFFPGVPILASGSYDNTIRIWDARTGENIHTLEGHTDAVTSVAFSPNGNTLASGSWNSTILLWQFKRFRTWGGVKHAADDSAMYTPVSSPLSTALPPLESALLPNYPNPFNPETWIPYQLKKPAEVSLTIFSMKGQAIRTLAVGHQPAGMYRNRERAAYWDGRNEMGERMGNGVYFCTLSAGDFSATRKMVVGK